MIKVTLYLPGGGTKEFMDVTSYHIPTGPLLKFRVRKDPAASSPLGRGVIEVTTSLPFLIEEQ